VDSLNPNEEEHKMLHSTKVICLVVLLAMTMPVSANAGEVASITETWQTANPEGERIFTKSDGEVTAVSDLGTGFRWGGWMEVNSKGKYPETRIDWDNKSDSDGVLRDFTDGKFEANGFEVGTHIYTIFSTEGTNVPDMSIPNLETVSLSNTKGQAWAAKLTIRDAQGDWYLSSMIELPGDSELQTISIDALTWEEIVGAAAADMNELDAGGPHQDQLNGSDDGDGPGPMNASATDGDSTSPDMSAITGGGIVYAGPAPGSKVWLGPVTWQGVETPPTAFQAFPAGIELAKPWGTVFRWRTGLDVAGETVYFGEDPNHLVDVTEQAVNNTYTPANLVLDTTYYWRVDSEQADGSVLQPPEGTWSFSVGEYAVVEGFEGFSDQDDNRIFQTWLDGWGYSMPEPGNPGNGTGSTVGYLNSPFAEQTIVNSGVVSMPFEYNNTGQAGKRLYAETVRTLDEAQDWTGIGGRALTFYAYGDADAAPAATDKIYVGLEDSDGNFADVHVEADLKLEEWQEINIDLQDFIHGGDVNDVNLVAIEKIYLGVGDSFNPQSGGTGKLFFDDVRVYIPRCLPEVSGLMGDLNNDCIVDQSDMDLLMEEYGLSAGDEIPMASGTLVTGALDAQDRVEFTKDWDGHRDSQDRYRDFYGITQDDGGPILELSFPEGGFWKFPRVYTSDSTDFTGTTNATIQWKAKQDSALCLYGVANNAFDTYYRFKFVLYDETYTGQGLGWVPNRNGEWASGDYDGGRSPSYLPGLLNYQNLVTGMTSDEYCTLTLTVVSDEQNCTIDYVVKQGNTVKGSGTLTPDPIDFNDGVDQGQTATSWWIGGAYGKPDQAPFEYLTGGFIKSCDMSSEKSLTADLNGDDVVDDLDVAIVEGEMGGEQVLWP
jgi:hypothetical protein